MKRPYRSREAGTSRGVVRVNDYSDSWLSKGFPWVYPKEVVSHPRSIKPGARVRIQGRQGRDLGAGIWDDGWLAVRRFREDPGPVDRALLSERLGEARSKRVLLPPDTDAWRLAHGENDGLPGVRIDVWGDWLTIRLDSPSLAVLLDDLVPALVDLMEPRGIFQGWRRDHRETGQGPPAGRCRLLHGQAPDGEVEVRERGMRFLVRPEAGADAGLYPDMRANRRWLDHSWSGSRVLNLFAYTGAFSVAAAIGGAREVHTSDLSKDAIARARVNFQRNNLALESHVFVQEDTFKHLDRLRRGGERFDRVIADPPSFSHGPGGTFSVQKDLPRLVSACLRVLEPGGLLIIASNLGTLSPRNFQGAVQKGFRKAKRVGALVYDGCAAPDYPAALEFPEGRYLKFQVLVA